MNNKSNWCWEYKYKETCECGNKMYVVSQPEDKSSEFIAGVGVPCPKCRKLLWFGIHVN